MSIVLGWIASSSHLTLFKAGRLKKWLDCLQLDVLRQFKLSQTNHSVCTYVVTADTAAAYN